MAFEIDPTALLSADDKMTLSRLNVGKDLTLPVGLRLGVQITWLQPVSVCNREFVDMEGVRHNYLELGVEVPAVLHPPQGIHTNIGFSRTTLLIDHKNRWGLSDFTPNSQHVVLGGLALHRPPVFGVPSYAPLIEPTTEQIAQITSSALAA